MAAAPAKRARVEGEIVGKEPTANKNAHAAAEDEFDEFDTSADDLLFAVQQAEQASKSSPVKATQAPPAPQSSSAEAAGDIAQPPPYTLPFIGTASDPLALERTTMNHAWFERLEPAMRQDTFLQLKRFLDGEKAAGKTIYPPPNLIHSWSRTTPLERVKVVIVGQDPYHQPGQACGHSFSVPRGKAVPASLQNIYKELRAEYPEFTPPKHGCLDGWAKQGVLLLNACLTVNAGQAGSHHGRGWEPFTRSILTSIAEAAKAKTGPLASMFEKKKVQSGPHKGVVFLAWGQPAARMLADAGITEKTDNVLLLRSPHPSPLSAHRGFMGNGHFRKANAWLEDAARYGQGGGIRWDDL